MTQTFWRSDEAQALRQPQQAELSADGPAGWRATAIAGVVLRLLQRHADARGWLIELFRRDELTAGLDPAMAYVSQTEPGVVRGPHEHLYQTDHFAFIGPGEFRLTLWDARRDSSTCGAQLELEVGQACPSAVVIPPGVVHAYQNIGSVSGWVFNAPDRLYAGEGKQGPVDEVRHEEQADQHYRLRED